MSLKETNIETEEHLDGNTEFQYQVVDYTENRRKNTVLGFLGVFIGIAIVIIGLSVSLISQVVSISAILFGAILAVSSMIAFGVKNIALESKSAAEAYRLQEELELKVFEAIKAKYDIPGLDEGEELDEVYVYEDGIIVEAQEAFVEYFYENKNYVLNFTIDNNEVTLVEDVKIDEDFTKSVTR